MNTIFRRHYLLFFALIISAISCVDPIPEEPVVPEGLPATLRFNVYVEESPSVTRGIPEGDERRVNSLYILIFNASGNVVTRAKYASIDGTLLLHTVSGNDMHIQVIANYGMETENSTLEAELDALTNLSTLRSIVVYQRPEDLVTPAELTMLGESTGMAINPGENNVTVPLQHLFAKVTITFTDQTPNQILTFLKCDYLSIPKYGYLIARDRDAIDHDSYNADDFYSFVDSDIWEREEYLSGQTVVSGSFYMLENRLGTVPSITNYKWKSAHAPAGATYAGASFICFNESNSQTYDIDMKVYLGSNNTSDFNVLRGRNYRIGINIKGVDSITINVDSDSNTSAVSIPLIITQSNSLTFDAHSDSRAFSIRKQTIAEDVVIEVLDEARRSYNEAGFNAQWVKISPLDLMRHQVSQTSSDANSDGVADNLYQQPAPTAGTAGYFVRPRYIPHKSYREAHAAEAWSEWPSALDADYNDDEMPLADATYRMCYKITDLLNNASGPDEETVYLHVYADENEYNGTGGDRNAFIRISYIDTADGNQLKYIDFQITQKQPPYVGYVVDTYDGTAVGSASGGLDNTNADVSARTTYKQIVIEQIEESAMYIIQEPEYASFQQVTQLQWGYHGYRLYNNTTDNFERHRNGYFLTANAVYGNGVNTWSATGNFVTREADGSDVDWSHIPNLYRRKYGAFNNAITEPAYTDNNSGHPYYYPKASLTAEDNLFFDPRFNASPARYCHEKNRDLNGDGIISPSETKWYLPSTTELYQIWISIEAIRNTTTEYGTDYYLSSTEQTGYAVNMIGFGSGYALEPIAKTSFESVRCVRKIE